MRSLTKLLSLLAVLVTVISLSTAQKKNILFIAVDDLRPEIAAFGHQYMITPNIDKFAEGGTIFQRAYVQYSFCAPSRNSFMTGRRPDKTRCFSFEDHFREVGPDWVSMPEYFRNNGYYTVGAGKLFHKGLPPNFDAPKSWDEFVYPDSGACKEDTNGWPVLQPGVGNVTCPLCTSGCEKDAVVRGDRSHWCSLDEAKLKQPTEDALIVKAATGFLDDAAASDRPFFLGVGFHKPHLPFYFPEKYDKIYPNASQIKPPAYPNPPTGMPLVAWHEGNFDNKWNSPATADQMSIYRRAYYSAVSYTDNNIGMVLEHLDSLDLANDTAVILMGDHGWQLGEMNLWRKMTNFELGVRVPLILRAPWIESSVGQKTMALAEAVDLFPTFVDLAGLPPVPASEGLDGNSLVPVLHNSSASVNEYAFSQFAKTWAYSQELKHPEPWDVCTKCFNSTISFMGFSVRDNFYRYTEWHEWNNKTMQPNFDGIYARELYDHIGDDGSSMDVATDTVNLASNSTYASIVEKLSQVIHAQFGPSH